MRVAMAAALLLLALAGAADAQDPCAPGLLEYCLHDDDADGVADGASASASAFVVGSSASARDTGGDGVPETVALVPIAIGVYVTLPAVPPNCYNPLNPSCFFNSFCVVCYTVSAGTSDPNADGVPNRAYVKASPVDVDRTV